MVQELIESGYIFVLPERDSQGRRVVFSVARVLDPSKHNTSHVVRAHIATFEVTISLEPSHNEQSLTFRTDEFIPNLIDYFGCYSFC